MVSPTDILAHGDMGIRGWMVGPITAYLIAWIFSIILVPINLALSASSGNSTNFRIANLAIWAFYAFPVVILFLAYCHIIDFRAQSLSNWLGITLVVYFFVVPFVAVSHGVYLIRRAVRMLKSEKEAMKDASA